MLAGDFPCEKGARDWGMLERNEKLFLGEVKKEYGKRRKASRVISAPRYRLNLPSNCQWELLS